jgi:chromosome segregation ATPase
MNLALAAQSVRDLEETIKELQDELDTERAATKAAKTSLSLLSGKTEGMEEALEAARGDLADARQEVSDLSVALISLIALQVEGMAAKRGLIEELQSTRRELTEKQKDVALIKSEQDKLSAEIASSHRDNNQLRSEKADLLAAGEEQAVRFSQEIEALQAELTASIDEIVVLKSDTERLQSEKRALQTSQLQVEAELSSALQRSADLNRQLETMRSAEAARSTQLESRLHVAEAAKKELEEAIATARSRLEAREVEMAALGKGLQEALSALETSTAGAREIELKLTAAMNDLEDVRTETEIVKRNSAESIAALEANHSSIAEEKQQLVQKASETEERVNLLANEIEALQVANKEMLGSTERIRQLETEIEDLRTSRDGALESAESAFERRLQSEQERLLHKVSEADGRIVQLEAQIKDLQRVQNEEMQSAKANFLQKLRESEEKVQELEAQRTEYLVTSEKLVSEGSELRSELALTTASIEQFKQCSADAEQRAGQAELRLVELQQQLQEAQAEAYDLRTSASDYAAGLDQAKLQAQAALAQLEEAKREVERECVTLRVPPCHEQPLKTGPLTDTRTLNACAAS